MNKTIAFIFVGIFWLGFSFQSFAGTSEEVQSLLPQNGKRVEIYPGEQPEDISQTVQNLLAQPLSVEDAVQVSLLNNPEIQATLQDLKISRAERLQGRLLPNPHVEATYHSGRLPETGEKSTHQEYKLLQDLNSILFYPLKWRLTAAQYDEAKMRVADRLQSQVVEVKKAYFKLQALQQKKFALNRIMQGVEAATELAKRQRQAGTLNALDLASQEAMLHENELTLARIETEVQTAREDLHRLLGLSQSEIAWNIPDQLLKPGNVNPNLSELETIALSQRPDLSASRQELKSLDRQVKVEFLGIIPSIEGGILWEKEDEFKSFGPYAKIEIPLTDWNQAAISKARSKRQQGRSRLQAQEARALTQVRALFKRLVTARSAVKNYEESILPLRVRIVEETQKHYNFMLSGVYQLLQAKQNEITAFQNYTESLEEYWITRTELEQAIGGSLPGFIETVPAAQENEMLIEPSTPDAPDKEDHHNHGGKK